MGRYYLSIPTIDNVDIPFSILQKCKNVYEKYGKQKAYQTLNEEFDFSPFISENTLKLVQNGGSKDAMNVLIAKRDENRKIELIKRYLYLYRAAMAQTISFAYNIDEYELTKKTKDFSDDSDECPYCGKTLTKIPQMGNMRAYPVSYYDDVEDEIIKEVTYERFPIFYNTNVSLYKYTLKLEKENIQYFTFSGWYLKDPVTGEASTQINANSQEKLFDYINFEDGTLTLIAVYSSVVGEETTSVEKVFTVDAKTYFDAAYIENATASLTIPPNYEFEGWTVKVNSDKSACPKIYSNEELSKINIKDFANQTKAEVYYVIKGNTEETVPYKSTVNECLKNILSKKEKVGYLFDKYTKILSSIDGEIFVEDEIIKDKIGTIHYDQDLYYDSVLVWDLNPSYQDGILKESITNNEYLSLDDVDKKKYSVKEKYTVQYGLENNFTFDDGFSSFDEIPETKTVDGETYVLLCLSFKEDNSEASEADLKGLLNSNLEYFAIYRKEIETLDKDIGEFIIDNKITLKANYIREVTEGTFAYDDKCYYCNCGVTYGIKNYGKTCKVCDSVCGYKGYIVNNGETNLTLGLKVLIYTNGKWIHYNYNGTGVYIRDIASMNSLSDYNRMVAVPNGSICYDDSVYTNKANQTLKLWMYIPYIWVDDGQGGQKKKYLDPNYEQVEKKLLEYADEREDFIGGINKWVYIPRKEGSSSESSCELYPTDSTGVLKEDYTIEGAKKLFKLKLGGGEGFEVKEICSSQLESGFIYPFTKEQSDLQTSVFKFGDRGNIVTDPNDVFYYPDVILNENNWIDYIGWYLVILDRITTEDQNSNPDKYSESDIGKLKAYEEYEITEEAFGVNGTDIEHRFYKANGEFNRSWYKSVSYDQINGRNRIVQFRPKLKLTLRELAFKWNINPVVETSIKQNGQYYCQFSVILSGNDIFDDSDYVPNNPQTAVILKTFDIKYAGSKTNIKVPEQTTYDSKVQPEVKRVSTHKQEVYSGNADLWLKDVYDKYFLVYKNTFEVPFNDIYANIYSGYTIDKFINSNGDEIKPGSENSVFNPETVIRIFKESGNTYPYEKVRLIKTDYKLIKSDDDLDMDENSIQPVTKEFLIVPALQVDFSSVTTFADRDTWYEDDGLTTCTIYGGFDLGQSAIQTSSKGTYLHRNVSISSVNADKFISNKDIQYYHYSRFTVNEKISVNRPILITESYLKEQGVYQNAVTWDILYTGNDGSVGGSVFEDGGFDDASMYFGTDKIPMNAIEEIAVERETKSRLLLYSKTINVGGVIISGAIGEEESKTDSDAMASSYGTTKVSVPTKNNEGETKYDEVEIPNYKIIDSAGHIVNSPYLFDDAGNYIGENPYYDPSYSGLNYAGWNWLGEPDENGIIHSKGIIEAYPIKDKSYYEEHNYERVIFIEDFNSVEYIDDENNAISLIRYCSNENCYGNIRHMQKSKWSFKGYDWTTAKFPGDSKSVKQKRNLSLDEYMFPWRTSYELYNSLGKETGIKGYRYYNSDKPYGWKNYNSNNRDYVLNHAINLHRGGGAYPDPYRFDFENKYATDEYSETRFNPRWPSTKDFTWKDMFIKDLKSIIGTSYVPMGKWKDQNGNWHEGEDLDGNKDLGRPILQFQDDYKNNLFASFETTYNSMIKFSSIFEFTKEEQKVLEEIVNDLSNEIKLSVINFIESYNNYIAYSTREWNRNIYTEKKELITNALTHEGLVFDEMSESEFKSFCNERLSEYHTDDTIYDYNKMWYKGKDETKESLKNVLSEFHEIFAMPQEFMFYLFGFITWSKFYILYFDARGGVGCVNASTEKLFKSELDGESSVVTRAADNISPKGSVFSPKINVISKHFPKYLDENTSNGINEYLLFQFGKKASDLRRYSFLLNEWTDKVYAQAQLKTVSPLWDSSKIPILMGNNDLDGIISVYPYEDKTSYGWMKSIDANGETKNVYVYTGYSNLLFVRQDGLYRFNCYTNTFIDSVDGGIKISDLFTEKTLDTEVNRDIIKAVFDTKTDTVTLLARNGEIASANFKTLSYCSSNGVTHGDNSPEISFNPNALEDQIRLSAENKSTQNSIVSSDSKNTRSRSQVTLLTVTSGNEELEDAILVETLGTLTPTTLDEGEWAWKLIDSNNATPLLPEEISDEYFKTLNQDDKNLYYVNPKITVKGAIDRLGINHDNIPTEITVDGVKYFFSNVSLSVSGVSILPTQYNDILTTNKGYYAIYRKEGVDEKLTRYGYKFYISEKYDSNGKDTIVGLSFQKYLDEIEGSVEDRFSKKDTGTVYYTELIKDITNIFQLDGYYNKTTTAYKNNYIPCFAFTNDIGQVQIAEFLIDKITGKKIFNIVLSLDYGEKNSKVMDVKYIPGTRKSYIVFKNQRITEISTYQYLPRIYNTAKDNETEHIKLICDNFDNNHDFISFLCENGDIKNIKTNNTTGETYEGKTYIDNAPGILLGNENVPVGIKEVKIDQIDLKKVISLGRKYSFIPKEDMVVLRN